MKKTILLIAGLLTFAILATGCLGQTDTPADQPEEFEATTTQEQLDTDIVVKAVTETNTELCETIESEEQKNECIVRVEDQIILEQAEDEIDLDLCKDISRSSTKDQCEILVRLLIDEENERAELAKFYEEIDAQITEDGEALKKATGGSGLPTPEDCEVIQNPGFKEGCLSIANSGLENE